MKTTQNMTPASVEEPEGDSTYLFITPTLLPEEKQGWNHFIHPLNHFTFTYPTEWRLKLLQHRQSPEWYRVILTDSTDTNAFSIHFETDGRGYPPYEERVETKELGGKSTTWKTLYQDGQAVELMISFPNGELSDRLIGLYVYLPEKNQDGFIKQLEQVVASAE